MSILNRDILICGYSKVVATKKGVRYSDYKLTYKGYNMYAVKHYDDNYNHTGWSLQSEDGGQLHDTVDTLGEAKAAVINYYENEHTK